MNKQCREPTTSWPQPAKKVLTAIEVAEYTGYSLKYVYKLVHQRKLPFYKPQTGRRLFFLLEELEQWLLANRGQTEIEIINKTINVCSVQTKFIQNGKTA